MIVLICRCLLVLILLLLLELLLLLILLLLLLGSGSRSGCCLFGGGLLRCRLFGSGSCVYGSAAGCAENGTVRHLCAAFCTKSHNKFLLQIQF